ncbi:hypothetical protein CLV98_101420 [Dyadobacter jejuensis]|uniref:Uncharacterized protein n=1 Tax=Dyadobacter jejuensis TaxID=1082580 RepID=A0A316ASF0_9BACT|nr:hypothetical protein CLV98_101420 [Dyadobacter jejuensis]
MFSTDGIRKICEAPVKAKKPDIAPPYHRFKTTSGLIYTIRDLRDTFKGFFQYEWLVS